MHISCATIPRWSPLGQMIALSWNTPEWLAFIESVPCLPWVYKEPLLYSNMAKSCLLLWCSNSGQVWTTGSVWPPILPWGRCSDQWIVYEVSNSCCFQFSCDIWVSAICFLPTSTRLNINNECKEYKCRDTKCGAITTLMQRSLLWASFCHR